MSRFEVVVVFWLATIKACSALSACCNVGISVGEQAKAGDITNQCNAINFQGVCKVEAIVCCKSVQSLHCNIGRVVAATGLDCSTLNPFQKECCNNHYAKRRKTTTTTTATATTTTTTTTTEKPTIPTKEPTKKQDKKKTCADVVCESLTTTDCVESLSGPKCICKSGFKLLKDGLTCQSSLPKNKDACKKIKCDAKTTLRCEVTNSGPKCICKTGYKPTKDGHSCQDIDECVEGDGVMRCHRTYKRKYTYCMNYPGYFRCSYNCPEPTYFKPKDGVCQDVDECATDTHNCDPDTHICENRIGSFYCKHNGCSPGYKLVSGECKEINQCKLKPCPYGQFCHKYYSRRLCIDETCPNKNYYVQKRIGELAECQLSCGKINDASEKKRCLDINKYPTSIKRYVYSFAEEIGYKKFSFSYWWDFDDDKFNVEAKLLDNDTQDFYVYTRTNNLDIFNQRIVQGPRNFHLILQVNVKRRTYSQNLLWRYHVHLYVNVS